MDENKEKIDENIEPADGQDELDEKAHEELVMSVAKEIFVKHRKAFEVLAGIDDDDE